MQKRCFRKTETRRYRSLNSGTASPDSTNHTPNFANTSPRVAPDAIRPPYNSTRHGLDPPSRCSNRHRPSAEIHTRIPGP